jgi:integrase
MKLTHRRDRFQRGCLTIERRKSGSSVWIFRWREPDTSGKQVNRKVVVGDKVTVEEVSAILVRLTEPCRTATLAAALTGLRRGELLGLKWNDVDFDNSVIHVRRSLVEQVAGKPKTIGSRRPLPMSADISKALECWRQITPYAELGDWVFASPASRGEQPYWASTLLTRHIRPAALDAGINKKIGWHTFRRTFATLLQSSGATVKTTQELMRHSTPVMTLGTYAQAVTADKREAQDRIAAMILPRPVAESGTLAA